MLTPTENFTTNAPLFDYKEEISLSKPIISEFNVIGITNLLDQTGVNYPGVG